MPLTVITYLGKLFPCTWIYKVVVNVLIDDTDQFIANSHIGHSRNKLV